MSCELIEEALVLDLRVIPSSNVLERVNLQVILRVKTGVVIVNLRCVFAVKLTVDD